MQNLIEQIGTFNLWSDTYKRPRKKQMQNISNEKTNGLFVYNKNTKIKYLTQQQTTTTELQSPDLGQAHTYIMWPLTFHSAT